ncbi:hypothetical protein [Maricaulis maris]|uniref:hypothetical protein n=1 Tax=Maricaulis maris TaxID=74318 RepID=UPI003B8AC858
MMKMTCLAAVSAAALASFPAQAQPGDWWSRLDPERLAGGEIHLELQYEGETDGFMRYGWRTEGDDIVLYDRTMWASGEVYETMEVRMRRDGLAPVSSDIRFHQGANYYVFDIDFEPGSAAGSVQIVQPASGVSSQPLSSDLTDGTILRASYFLVAAAFPFEIGDSVSLNWFATMSNTEEAVTLTAIGEADVETPAGVYRTLHIEQRGGTPPNDIYIDRESGRIVRIDVGGQPMSFVAPAE